MSYELEDQIDAWLNNYDENILPLRVEAEKGRRDYIDYDTAYGKSLEDLHRIVFEWRKK